MKALALLPAKVMEFLQLLSLCVVVIAQDAGFPSVKLAVSSVPFLTF